MSRELRSNAVRQRDDRWDEDRGSGSFPKAGQQAESCTNIAALPNETFRRGSEREQEGGALHRTLNEALAGLWLAWQPIVCWGDRSVFAYEALMRSTESALPHPGAILEAAERLGRLDEVGEVVRGRVAEQIASAPTSTVFVNLHASDLLSDALYDAHAPLSQHASRVVLEVTERAAVEKVSDCAERVRALRGMGFRIAIDDLGAGYAGLSSFALLAPELVKIDMSLVRNLHREPIKQRLVQALANLCTDMGIYVVAEGVEVPEERDTLVGLGCELLQGFLFARPAAGFGVPVF